MLANCIIKHLFKNLQHQKHSHVYTGVQILIWVHILIHNYTHKKYFKKLYNFSEK